MNNARQSLHCEAINRYSDRMLRLGVLAHSVIDRLDDLDITDNRLIYAADMLLQEFRRSDDEQRDITDRLVALDGKGEVA